MPRADRKKRWQRENQDGISISGATAGRDTQEEAPFFCRSCGKYMPREKFYPSCIAGGVYRCKTHNNKATAAALARRSKLDRAASEATLFLRRKLAADSLPSWAKQHHLAEVKEAFIRFDSTCQMTGSKRGLTVAPFEAIPEGQPWEPWNMVLVTKGTFSNLVSIAGRRGFRVGQLFAFDPSVAERVAQAKKEAEAKRGRPFPEAIPPSEDGSEFERSPASVASNAKAAPPAAKKAPVVTIEATDAGAGAGAGGGEATVIVTGESPVANTPTAGLKTLARVASAMDA